MDSEFLKGYRYEIFIGLKDKDSYEELLTVNDFKEILCDVCAKDNLCFSLSNQFGGYNHNKGYTTETSVRVIIVGIDEEKVIALSELLKKKVNTDTILISKDEVEYAFL